jgi:hypothetical protein
VLAIAQAAGNKRVAGVLEEMERLLHLGLAVRNRSGEMQHEHKSLVEALANGDADAAERTTIEQIEAAPADGHGQHHVRIVAEGHAGPTLVNAVQRVGGQKNVVRLEHLHV